MDLYPDITAVTRHLPSAVGDPSAARRGRTRARTRRSGHRTRALA